MSRISFRSPLSAPRMPARDRWTPDASPARSRDDVEAMLKEIAFVLHATRTVKDSLARPRAPVTIGR
jgi:hypothetical protein